MKRLRTTIFIDNEPEKMPPVTPEDKRIIFILIITFIALLIALITE